ncbi:HOG (high osmolarity glycerol) pathway protein [Dispira parvispora]|uniref:HOG (High osmolarity glycerol) pathway protein n=1 Tax=Dispira parvispora TaxID=1520584 RepID=A0A9W8E2C1_9FUNG|nr:HOG (high osmolarity glycerol) pathway protein [Dispira parvispora]
MATHSLPPIHEETANDPSPGKSSVEGEQDNVSVSTLTEELANVTVTKSEPSSTATKTAAEPDNQTEAGTGWSDSEASECDEPNTTGLIIRDFAYAPDDERFLGRFPNICTADSDDESDQSIEWAEQDANGELTLSGVVRALYDFEAENPSELSFKESDLLYIQYKQCAGWFVGYLNGQVGLIPENYVQFMRVAP